MEVFIVKETPFFSVIPSDLYYLLYSGNQMDSQGDDSTMEYLNIVEPFPMEPPSYTSTLPRIDRPSYDSLESLNESLPRYSPTVYKIGVFYRKMEWISPYEMAQQRQWTPYIVELNNTQLNFYEIDNNLIKGSSNVTNGIINHNNNHDKILDKFNVSSSFSNSNSHSLLHPYHHHHLYLKKLQGIKCPSAINQLDKFEKYKVSYNEDNYRSIMTTKTDLKALYFLKSIKSLESTKIFRSYSLQYGKVGLAIDYKKRDYVFRCRFETEQFLIDFKNAEGMIEWYNAINLGIDNSLDLSRREMPNYRTVPRRRRRRYQNHSVTKNIVFGLGLTSSQMLNDSYRHKEKDKDKDKNKDRRGSSSSSRRGSVSNGHKKLFHVPSLETLFKSKKDKKDSSGIKFNSFRRRSSTVSNQGNYLRKEIKINRMDDTSNSTNLLEDEGRDEGEDRDGDDELDDEDIEEDDMDMEDEMEEEEEEDELVDEDEDEFNIDGGRNEGDEEDTDIESEENIPIGNLNLNEQLRTYTEYISKVNNKNNTNKHTYAAQRKILRDSIRCMIPLTENERWVNKLVLLDYQKNYKPQSREMIDRHFQCFEVMSHVSGVGQNYEHRFKRPLQEWIVTPSGLIAYMNTNAGR